MNTLCTLLINKPKKITHLRHPEGRLSKSLARNEIGLEGQSFDYSLGSLCSLGIRSGCLVGKYLIFYVTLALITLIKYTRPLLGPSGCCIYPVTCTQFAYEELNKEPLHRAVYRISIRVILCNPFTKRWALRLDKTH